MPVTDDRIPPASRRVLDQLLDNLELRSQGLITEIHLTGSIALGDARTGQGDIDLVLVRTDGADNAATKSALEPVLADLRYTYPRPTLDGLVLTAADLEAGPDRIMDERPNIFDNAVRLGTGGSGRNPVTWQTLRQCGVVYRGTPIAPERLWHDPVRLDCWTRENLQAYWRPWLAKSDRLPSRFGAVSLGTWATEWGVLGITRLHYTLTTGKVTSKHGAGCYALETFEPEWHRIVREALRIRERRNERSLYRNPLQRRDAMRAYVDMVINHALALPLVGRKGP